MSLRIKLKESKMRLVELATYLEISRPTLYKYLEDYEAKEYANIDKRCIDLFSFIDNTSKCSRPIIMEYLINKILPIENSKGSYNDIISSVRKLSESPKELDTKKMSIIDAIATTSKLDGIIDILLKQVKSKKKIKIQEFENALEEGEE